MSGEHSDDYSKYLNERAFHEFLDRQFELVARDATVEELADFAFGTHRRGDTCVQTAASACR